MYVDIFNGLIKKHLYYYITIAFFDDEECASFRQVAEGVQVAHKGLRTSDLYEYNFHITVWNVCFM